MTVPEVENPEIVQQRISISQTLLASAGSDFRFMDRDSSFEILASCLEQRFYCHQVKDRDRFSHRIAFLADGPGSGKSRFLQELPHSFVAHVENMSESNFQTTNSVTSYLQSNPLICT